MSRRVLIALALGAAALATATGPARGLDATLTVPTSTVPATVADNEFIPEDRNLSDCVSALPRPDCGSDNRSGWRQWLILGAIIAALAFIAWRVVRAARRVRPTTGAARDDT